MIEFDDAGTGCPIVGEVYVARQVETDESVSRFIPAHSKENKNEILMNMLNVFQPTKDEVIFLCQGRIFNGFEQQLKQAGYQVLRTKIEGVTDHLAEEYFNQELRKIGVPSSIRLENRDYGTFYQQVMLWYDTFYKGKSLRKHEPKPNTLDYLFYRVHHYPHLVASLFGISCDLSK